MSTKNINNFRGEIENFLGKDQNNFDSKINDVLTALNIKTILCQAGIIKKDGYHAAQIFLILLLLPMLSMKTIHCFFGKFWTHIFKCGKDVYNAPQKLDNLLRCILKHKKINKGGIINERSSKKS